MLRTFALCSTIIATLFATTSIYAAEADSISHSGSGSVTEKTLAQLPHNVVPQNYVINLVPSVDTMRIAGSETITLHFTEFSDKIQFNSANQKLAHVLFDGAPVQTVYSNENTQLTTIKLDTPATAGQHTLSFAFVGQMGTKLHGLFTQPDSRHRSSEGLFLTAQFEGTETHRIFPCWDDPSFAASYQLNVTVPTEWRAWSSMPTVMQDVQGQFTTISYLKTSELRSEIVEFSNVRRLKVPENYIGKN